MLVMLWPSISKVSKKNETRKVFKENFYSDDCSLVSEILHLHEKVDLFIIIL